MDHSPSSALPKPETKTLRFTTKFTYGLGELSAAIPGNILSFFFLFFLTNIAGLSASKAGTVMLISKAWDAINDPLIGWLSDHTRSPWGRRYPWIVCGAVPLGLFFGLLWIVPTFSQDVTLNQQALFGYYGVLGVLFYAAFTSVLLPFSALAPELTQDYHERTSLISFKSAFSVGGAILALVLAQVIFSVVEHPSQKYLVLGIVCATCAVVSVYVSVLGTHRVVLNQQATDTVNASVRPSLPWRSQIGYIFANRPFLYVMGIYLCSWLGVQITAAILPYFVINWMGLPDHHFTQVAIAVQGTALMMMFIWSFVSKRVGKKAVYLIGMPLFAIRMIIGPLPTLILICGLVFSYFYPITREVHVQILHQLWERNHQS